MLNRPLQLVVEAIAELEHQRWLRRQKRLTPRPKPKPNPGLRLN